MLFNFEDWKNIIHFGVVVFLLQFEKKHMFWFWERNHGVNLIARKITDTVFKTSFSMQSSVLHVCKHGHGNLLVEAKRF